MLAAAFVGAAVAPSVGPLVEEIDGVGDGAGLQAPRASATARAAMSDVGARVTH